MSHLLKLASCAGALAMLAASWCVPVAIADDPDPNDQGGLNQVIDPNQQQGTDRVVLDEGHVDFGPTLNTGEWLIEIHDDTSIPRYWRLPSDVVFRVNDEAVMQVPDDPAYSFIGAEPGSDVYVIPQTQKSGVIWAGWNTQEPNVMEQVDLGVTMSLVGVEGPGEMVVYLQSGNLGAPEKLYSSQDSMPQETWLSSNTHTHANWVFTQPGIYLVQIQIDATLHDGTAVSAQDTLRFAVGSDADTDAAFAATISEDSINQSATVPTESEPAARQGLPGFVWVIIVIVAAAIVIAVIVMAAANRRMKATVRRARQSTGDAVSCGEESAGDHAQGGQTL